MRGSVRASINKFKGEEWYQMKDKWMQQPHDGHKRATVVFFTREADRNLQVKKGERQHTMGKALTNMEQGYLQGRASKMEFEGCLCWTPCTHFRGLTRGLLIIDPWCSGIWEGKLLACQFREQTSDGKVDGQWTYFQAIHSKIVRAVRGECILSNSLRSMNSDGWRAQYAVRRHTRLVHRIWSRVHSSSICGSWWALDSACSIIFLSSMS